MFQVPFMENYEQISSKKRSKLDYIGMFHQLWERREFCRNDYHQFLERNWHLNALSANIMLIFALVEAF